eukprot:m.37821 g.37821  ORF g.37821 m.37821 type:complete len:365 (+) comp7741_c0_seq1:1080-2174(+)
MLRAHLDVVLRWRRLVLPTVSDRGGGGGCHPGSVVMPHRHHRLPAVVRRRRKGGLELVGRDAIRAAVANLLREGASGHGGPDDLVCGAASRSQVIGQRPAWKRCLHNVIRRHTRRHDRENLVREGAAWMRERCGRGVALSRLEHFAELFREGARHRCPRFLLHRGPHANNVVRRHAPHGTQVIRRHPGKRAGRKGCAELVGQSAGGLPPEGGGTVHWRPEAAVPVRRLKDGGLVLPFVLGGGPAGGSAGGGGGGGGRALPRSPALAFALRTRSVFTHRSPNPPESLNGVSQEGLDGIRCKGVRLQKGWWGTRPSPSSRRPSLIAHRSAATAPTLHVELLVERTRRVGQIGIASQPAAPRITLYG